MVYNLLLNFQIVGSRHEVNRLFRSIRCSIQAGDRFCNDFFQAEEHNTHPQNYLSFTWKDIEPRSPSWPEEQEHIKIQVGQMCSHLRHSIRTFFFEQSRTLAIEVEIYE